MAESGPTGGAKTFKGASAKDVLSRVSRQLGPNAVIVAHGRTPDGEVWAEASASHPEGSPLERAGPRLFLAALGIFAVVAAGAIAWKFLNGDRDRLAVPARLTAAVIGFEDNTGDGSHAALAEVIPNLLITCLEQSGFFDVIPWERMQNLLEQGTETSPDAIDPDLVFRLCLKEKFDVLVMGSYTRIGEVFATDVKVFDVKSRKVRISASSKGAGEESLLRSQVDELGREILEGFGFFAPGRDGAPVRIADITTDSMDAYYHYLRGRECYSNENLKDARVFLEKAVQLDPQFATAHFYLATTLNLSGERRSAIEACKIAAKLADRATEKERLLIRGMGSMLMSGDYNEAIRVFGAMARQFPNERDAHYGLGIALITKGAALGYPVEDRRDYESGIKELRIALELDPYDSKTLGLIAIAHWDLQEHDKAVEYYRRQIAASPGNGLARSRLAAVLHDIGRLEEAAAMCDEAFEADPDVRVTSRTATIYALVEDYDKALRIMDGNAQVERYNLFQKGVLDYLAGNLGQAESDVRRLMEYAAERESSQSEANALWLAGWIALDRVEYDLARSSFAGWLDIYARDILPKRENVEAVIRQWRAWLAFYLGLTDVREGKLVAAAARLAEVDAALPGIPADSRGWVGYQRKLLAAEIALAEGDALRAVAIAEASPLTTGNADPRQLWLRSAPFFTDVLARAYYRSGDIDKAIAEYERLIAINKRGAEYYLIHPFNYFRLAELYEQKEMIPDSVRCYERFLDLWKGADDDIPEIGEARERLARLKGGT